MHITIRMDIAVSVYDDVDYDDDDKWKQWWYLNT